ncbi:MAG: division/cell wall cluster transcriptional repressor MraZ [Alphaproteobacteria bacterium]|nr:division/cell wall cluster transcriptional repressor MraZ [Alphaproteobacteria bacterium]MDG2465971.1 division/cell wall cluster transcriptional repressor MraZ [Alphaproteobacteria bacterium]
MELFTSTFENKVDRKGRVSVPAKYRAILDARGEPIILTRSLTLPCLEGMSLDRMNKYADAIDSMDAFSEEAEMLQMIIASAQEMRPDSEGRIVLPEEFLSHADISDAATFIGIGRSFQLWNPLAYQSRENKSRQAARDGKMPKLILNPRPRSGDGA